MSLSNNNIQFEKISDNAVIPTRANEGDCGYDLYSAENVTVPSGTSKLVKTDICTRLPTPLIPGTSVYARIAPRSGLAYKKSINILAGVIDKSYTGNLGVILINHGSDDFVVNCGDRVAQLIVTLCMTPSVEEVDNISTEVTDRGAGGFGSSGK